MGMRKGGGERGGRPKGEKLRKRGEKEPSKSKEQDERSEIRTKAGKWGETKRKPDIHWLAFGRDLGEFKETACNGSGAPIM